MTNPNTKAAGLVERLRGRLERIGADDKLTGGKYLFAEFRIADVNEAADTLLALTDAMEKMREALDWYADHDPQAVEAIRAHAAIQKEK